MAKDDLDDMLGGTAEAPAKAKKPAVKKAPKAEAAAEAKPAKAKKAKAEDVVDAKPAKKAKTKDAGEAKVRAPKPPVVFAEGEREELFKRIPRLSKKPINSRDLAAKLEIETRKLRPVLYSMERAGTIALERGQSRLAGMTVTAAAAQ